MKTRGSRLTADDWVQAGLRALINGGAPAVRIETLAAALKATKGSFYWHFKDMRTLKLSMLQAWLHKGMLNMIHYVEPEKTPKAKLSAIARLGMQDPDPELSCSRIEAAMREWGRQDQEIARNIAASDEKRLEYIVSLFEGLGFAPPEATRRAATLIALYVGLLHLNAIENRAFPINILEFVEILADPTADAPIQAVSHSSPVPDKPNPSPPPLAETDLPFQGEIYERWLESVKAPETTDKPARPKSKP